MNARMDNRRQTVRKSVMQALIVLDPSEEACVYLKDALDLLNDSREYTEKVTDSDYLANRYKVKNHKARIVLDD